MRVGAQLLGASDALLDRIWDRGAHSFTRAVARGLRSAPSAIYAYEYTALEAFQRAQDLGIRTIIDFPSLDGRETERLLRREREKFPDLIPADEEYFRARFERRQQRRDRERALADLVVTNSNLTRESHIRAGASPERTVAVPLGAPPALTAPVPRTVDRPLRLLWAGTFSARKGAHYLIEALGRLGPLHRHFRVDVYGRVTVPSRLCAKAPANLSFHGSVPRADLFSAFDAADLLVLPTLSDGFGMVIVEALARGLPVITTASAGAADFIEDRGNGLLIPAGDALALADAIRWSLDHRQQLPTLGERALEVARSWQWSDYRRALRAAIDGEPVITPSSRAAARNAMHDRVA